MDCTVLMCLKAILKRVSDPTLTRCFFSLPHHLSDH